MKLRVKPWAPDSATLLGNAFLKTAQNCVPLDGAYGPMYTPEDVEASATALDSLARGAIGGRRPGGSAYNFSGTATKIYHLNNPAATSPGQTDISRTSGGAYHADGKARWIFREIRGYVLACNPFDVIQYYNLGSSSTFEDCGDSYGEAPQAKVMGVIGQHAIVGDTYDHIDGRVPERIWWPAIANPTSWPDPRIDADLALSNQSGYIHLGGTGGAVQAVVGGAEIGAVFREGAIHRLEYVGGDVMYDEDRVESSGVHGLLVPDLAIPYGREILYLQENGWWLFNFTTANPVGEGIINRYFLADLDQSYLHRISWAVDPRRPVVYILYPGSGNVSGAPNKILCYNPLLRQFSEVVPTSNLELLTQAVPPGLSLDDSSYDGLDALDPKLDDPSTGPQDLVMAAYNTDHELQQLTDEAMEATVEWQDVEIEGSGIVSTVDSARPLVEGGDSRMQAAGRMRKKDTYSFCPERHENRDGLCHLRKTGRYHALRLIVSAGGFDLIHGIDIQHVPSGGR